MAVHPRAGTQARAEDLDNIPKLVSHYFLEPDELAAVSFGTSGHRGCSLDGSFNEAHIAAVCQALAEFRAEHSIKGPLFLGKDTHALSECAFATSIEVLTANGVDVVIQEDDGFTPTPVISHAILAHNAEADTPRADGIVITPSHNPPRDGGFKYNPPNGGPADTDITDAIQTRANTLLKSGNRDIRRQSLSKAFASGRVHKRDYVSPYVADLINVVDLKAVADAQVNIGVDPMGGSGVHFWSRIAEHYGLNLTVTNDQVDPRFAFMTLDKDGKIRMDCSSPYAMAGLLSMKSRFDIALGNDPDFDRHGIVTPSGLMNPNHYLAVAIHYLFTHRPEWPTSLSVGKTLVSSSMIDRVAKDLERPLAEVPVGFKWFVDGLYEGRFGFGGEESAGASFLRRDGKVWTTDKDGFIPALLAAEITAVTGKDPSAHYQALTQRFGSPAYTRIDAPATSAQKKVLKNLSADHVKATELAGEKILNTLTHAPANQAAIGGLKVVTENGWFAARPSGTEEIYKIYAESFLGEGHLKSLCEEAQAIVSKTFSEQGA